MGMVCALPVGQGHGVEHSEHSVASKGASSHVRSLAWGVGVSNRETDHDLTFSLCSVVYYAWRLLDSDRNKQFWLGPARSRVYAVRVCSGLHRSLTHCSPS